jgi:hypothetical protein
MKKKLGEKKGHKNHPKKKEKSHGLLCCPAGAKRKIGVEQGIVPTLFSEVRVCPFSYS